MLSSIPFHVALIATLIGAIGCASSPNDDPATTGSTGMALTAVGDGEIDGIDVTITEVRCDTQLEPEGYDGLVDFSSTVRVSLESFPLPDAFADRPFAEDSEQAFGDLFQILAPGCYDITGVPMGLDDNDRWRTLEDCSTANADHVIVYQETTTEVVLVSQCQSVQNGALDTVVTVNREPTLTVDFEPSKFAETCDTTAICATATDPDGDPLEFEWTIPVGVDARFRDAAGDTWDGQEQPGESTAYIDQSATVGAAGASWTSCIEVSSRIADQYTIIVRAYDFHWTDQIAGNVDDPPLIRYFTAQEPPEASNGFAGLVLTPERLEDYCTRQQAGHDASGCDSVAALAFPYYVGEGDILCDIGNPSGGRLVSHSDPLANDAFLAVEALEFSLQSAEAAELVLTQGEFASALVQAETAQQWMSLMAVDAYMEQLENQVLINTVADARLAIDDATTAIALILEDDPANAAQHESDAVNALVRFSQNVSSILTFTLQPHQRLQFFL